MSENRTLVSFDWAIKNILRDKANFDILEGFLSALLKQDIKILSILESEGNQRHETDKFNRVDLIVENSTGELLIIEVQNSREVHYLERLLYGSSKLIVDHIEIGDSYERVRKVISISILYFLLGEGEDDYIYHGKTYFYGLNTHRKLTFSHRKKEAIIGNITDSAPSIFPEYYLIEVERFQNVINSDIDEWIYFLKNSEIKSEFTSKNIQHARAKLDLLTMPTEERKTYEKFLSNRASEKDVIETARVEGFEDGIEKGIEKGIANVAVKMLAKENYSFEDIAEATGLSLDQIKTLAQNLK